MKVLIFGATGGTGRELIRQALERGYSVTAFARDPATLGDHAHLRALAGDVLDAPAVERAVVDQDAVICAVGRPAVRPGTVRSEGTRNIIRAMQAGGPSRLICMSTIGTGETRRLLPRTYRYVLVPLLLRATFAEHERQEAAVRSSELEWTVVRAGALTDGERTGDYRHGVPPVECTIQFEVSRADVADFILEQLVESAYLRKAPIVSH